jgi:hypothetical protein
MMLKLNSDICLSEVKRNLSSDIKKKRSNNYSFEINLIFKIIHEYSNYEDHQWQLYGCNVDDVEKEIKSLLLGISRLDKSLTWDCISVFYRYKNLLKSRNETAIKYLRS